MERFYINMSDGKWKIIDTEDNDIIEAFYHLLEKQKIMAEEQDYMSKEYDKLKEENRLLKEENRLLKEYYEKVIDSKVNLQVENFKLKYFSGYKEQVRDQNNKLRKENDELKELLEAQQKLTQRLIDRLIKEIYENENKKD